MNRRSFVARAGGALAFGKARAQLAPSPPKPPPSPQEILKRWRAGWANPPRTFKPHTRWWWPGSAVTREGIDWQLAQMKEQGIGGIELIACWEMYEKGCIAS